MAELEQTVISPAVEEEVAERLRVAVSSLPAHALKDLISLGACVRCIFRLFGVYEGISTDAFLSLSPSILCAVLGKVMDLDRNVVLDNSSGSVDTSNLQCSQELEGESSFCKICLGVLQFIYLDQQGVLFKRDHAHDIASIIAENVKQECHEIDNFLFEVSLPPVITGNEQAILLYMTRKYESEIWFKEKFLSRSFSVKDLFKLSIIHPLEKLLGVQSGQSSFRIRITYDHLDTFPKVQNNKIERNHHNKRMKTEDSGFHSAEGNGLAKVPNKSLQGCTTSDWSKFQLEKVQKPCQMTFTFCRTPVYIGGRYLKYSRNVSQSRWIIDDERKGDASVEEIIGSSILPVCRGDSYKFHAAGREDIDVRMLGSGRPFLIEIQNARHVPSELSAKEIERKINSMETKLVRVKNVEVLGSEGWALMHEGEAEKQKQYAALVWISRCIKDDDVQTISLMKDLQILQRTPIRVLHRRSPLEREKIIHWMKVEKLAGSSQYFLLHLCTQAGTYIKEFVHGDLGRTHPSIGSILGCRAEILQLDVTDVKMDCFLPQ